MQPNVLGFAAFLNETCYTGYHSSIIKTWFLLKVEIGKGGVGSKLQLMAFEDKFTVSGAVFGSVLGLIGQHDHQAM